MSNLKAVGWLILFTAILMTLLIWLTSDVLGYEMELTREIKISENLQNDFNQAVAEMVKEMFASGCKLTRGLAYTSDAKPGILTIVVACADEDKK